MYSRLVIDGNAVYEIDEECVQKKKNRGYKAGKRRGEERKEEKGVFPKKTGAHKRPLFSDFLRKISRSRHCRRHSSIKAAGSR